MINRAPALPDPVLQRPIPPPAPLPSESVANAPTTAGWMDDRKRRKRTEDIVGTVTRSRMGGAMLIAMWLRMTGP